MDFGLRFLLRFCFTLLNKVVQSKGRKHFFSIENYLILVFHPIMMYKLFFDEKG